MNFISATIGEIRTIDGITLPGYRLNFRSIDTYLAKTKLQCIITCRTTDNCNSVNFVRNGDRFECDLQTRGTDHIEYLTGDSDSNYVCKYYI